MTQVYTNQQKQARHFSFKIVSIIPTYFLDVNASTNLKAKPSKFKCCSRCL